MPLTKKGSKIMGSMMKEYGKKKGKSVFYASANKGTISGVHGSGKFSSSEIAKGYKVEYNANDLAKLEGQDAKVSGKMAKRVKPVTRQG